jgi:hypothetical protein
MVAERPTRGFRRATRGMARLGGGEDDPGGLWTRPPESSTIPLMAPHLRLVTAAPTGLSFVVARSVHVRPGTPYVLAACVEEAVAEVLALSGHGTYTEEEMRGRQDLAAALAAWEAGDNRIHRSDRAAALSFARAATRADALARHPSRLSKAPAGASRP